MKMRYCKYCNELLPSWYAKNVWYHKEDDGDCRRASKMITSNNFYQSLKQSDKQLSDDAIISRLATHIGLNVDIDWSVFVLMGFTWDSYTSIEIKNGGTIYSLPSYNYEIFSNSKIKIYNK